jgi:hypothetical protein
MAPAPSQRACEWSSCPIGWEQYDRRPASEYDREKTPDIQDAQEYLATLAFDESIITAFGRGFRTVPRQFL